MIFTLKLPLYSYDIMIFRFIKKPTVGLYQPFTLKIQNYLIINLVDQQTGETLEAKFVKQ